MEKKHKKIVLKHVLIDRKQVSFFICFCWRMEEVENFNRISIKIQVTKETLVNVLFYTYERQSYDTSFNLALNSTSSVSNLMKLMLENRFKLNFKMKLP